MINKDKLLLIKQAARLTTLGATVEKHRGKLKKLAERGVPYDDPKMLNTLEDFQKADNQWKQLETEHIQLRNKLGMK